MSRARSVSSSMRPMNSWSWAHASVSTIPWMALAIPIASEAPMCDWMNCSVVLAVLDCTCLFHRIRRNWAAGGGDQVGEVSGAPGEHQAPQILGVATLGVAPGDHVGQGVAGGEGRQAALVGLDRDHVIAASDASASGS